MLGVAWRVGEGQSGERVVGHGLRDDSGFYEIGPDVVTEHYLGHYRIGRDEIDANASVYSIDYEWEDPWDARMQALAIAVDRQVPPARRTALLTNCSPTLRGYTAMQSRTTVPQEGSKRQLSRCNGNSGPVDRTRAPARISRPDSAG